MPPYESKPPKRPRSAKYLEETYPAAEDGAGFEELQRSALADWSDWSRYEVSGRIDNFLATRLGEPVPEPEPPEPLEDLRISKRGWKAFVASLDESQGELIAGGEFSAEELVDSFSDEQALLLTRAYVHKRRKKVPQAARQAIPLERARRLIFQRCIELGWTPERFGHFDFRVGRRGGLRESHKGERFGKKYQWIALHELLARLADNFTFKEWEEVEPYEGAWQISTRDIDPSLPPEPITIGEDQEHRRGPAFSVDPVVSWWTTGAPDFEAGEPGGELEWTEDAEAMPAPEKLLRARDDSDRAWVVADGFFGWSHDFDDVPSVSREPEARRDLTIRALGTVIRHESLAKLRRWLAEEPDLLRAMPDWQYQAIHNAFWVELPEEASTRGRPAGWRPARGEGRLPIRSAAVALSYSAEASGADCSLSSGLNVDLPSMFMAKLGGARWSEVARMWVDRDDRPFAQFRQTDEGFRRDHALLLAEDALAELLAKEELVLVIGLFSERRAFEHSEYRGRSEMIGWTDYAGHLIFDGESWKSGPMTPVERHHRRVSADGDRLDNGAAE